MKTKPTKMDVSTLAPLLLFTVFTLCVVIVLLMGAQVYKASVDRDQRSYDHRTVAQYLSNRVRQLDQQDAWFIGDFDDPQAQEEGSTLYFREVIQDQVYYTRIYCYDGYLYELSSVADVDFAPEDGEKVLPLSSLRFYVEDGLLNVQFQYADGEQAQLLLTLRNGKAVTP